MPCARIASRLAPRTMKVTSSPAAASLAPTNPPIAPAPITATFMHPPGQHLRPSGGRHGSKRAAIPADGGARLSEDGSRDGSEQAGLAPMRADAPQANGAAARATVF